MHRYLEPTEDLIRIVAENMRQDDIEEVWASHRSLPFDALMTSWKLSNLSSIVEINGELCAMFGVRKMDVLSGRGVPWMLSTNHLVVPANAREFLKGTKSIVAEMLDACPLLQNYVYTKNRLSIRWLKWIGFTIEAAEPAGKGGELFHRFHMTKAEYNV